MGYIVCYILFLIIGLFPINNPYVVRVRKLYIIQKTLNILLCFSAIAFHVIFFTNRTVNKNAFIAFLMVEIIMTFTISVCARKIIYKNLKKRIINIPNYRNLTESEIRRILLQKYDEAYFIKEIKKALPR